MRPPIFHGLLRPEQARYHCLSRLDRTARLSRVLPRAVVTVALGGWLALAGVCRAQETPKALKIPPVKFTAYRLSNGLRVLLAPDRAAPVVAVSVTYDVGSRNERPGRSGFAHLFEHLMFQGSENVGRGEHFVLVNDNGGSFNGTTNQDRTNFFETLPANQLELGLFLEADRMRALDVNQDNLDNQRLVVQEERRQSYDNQPFGGFQEALLDIAHSNYAYKHSTIGSMTDLNAATLADVRDFYKTYYVPNNAVLAVVGDFDVKSARALVERTFGKLPRRPAPPPLDLSEPELNAPQTRVVEDALARQQRLAIAYPTVSGDDPDSYALSLLGSVLTQGRTSRMRTALVTSGIAQNATANGRESRGPSLFTFNVTLSPTADPKKAEAAIADVIAKIQADGPTETELRRAKASAQRQALASRQTSLARANTLSEYAVFYNDPNRINTLLPHLEAITAQDVQRVAQKYLVAKHKIVVIGKPARPVLNPSEDDTGNFQPNDALPHIMSGSGLLSSDLFGSDASVMPLSHSLPLEVSRP